MQVNKNEERITLTNMHIHAILKTNVHNLKIKKMKDLAKTCAIALLILVVCCIVGQYFAGHKISEKQIWGVIILASIEIISLLSSLRSKLSKNEEAGFLTEASIIALLISLLVMIFSSPLSEPKVIEKQTWAIIIFALFGVTHELLSLLNYKLLKK